MSNYFGKLNKTQLAEYARPLGINTQLKKQDLIEQIEAAAGRERSSLENDPLFADYFETLEASSPNAVIRAITPKSTTRRRSRYSKAPEDEDTGDLSSEPPTETIVTPPRKAKVGTRSARKSSALIPRAEAIVAAPTTTTDAPDVEPEPFNPLSPGDVARSAAVSNFTAESIMNTTSGWLSAAAETTGFWEHVDYTRETLSDPRAIHFIIATYELAWLCKDLIPWDQVTVPIPANRLPYVDYDVGPRTIEVPDLFILLSWDSFWSYVVYWFTLGISFPLLASYFINIRQRTAYDPLTFSITKALISYLVYNKKVAIPDWPRVFPKDAPVIITGTLGHETPLIGAAIGGLLTFWDAILSKRS